ncbi:hypothetical protein QBZ16_001727 [Prototheca wickerhamii]|uniref:Uncharacterized protein n=1 Tax=Prototheca wickerhamii TaxID=3111 RepID=A0AAD9ID26_PROWI|nr:hypothetical protein QBZ16_001727 [Prototheca wickerhamii]
MAPRVAISLHGVPACLTRPGVLASLRALAAEAHTSAAASPSESPRRGGFVPIDWRTVDPGMEAMELSRSELHINSALWVEPKPELTGEGFELGADRRVTLRDELPKGAVRPLPFFSSVMDRVRGSSMLESDWENQRAMVARLPALQPWWAERAEADSLAAGETRGSCGRDEGPADSWQGDPSAPWPLPEGVLPAQLYAPTPRKPGSNPVNDCSMKWLVPEVVAALEAAGLSVPRRVQVRLISALTRVDLTMTAAEAGELRGTLWRPARIKLFFSGESAADAVAWLRDLAGIAGDERVHALLLRAPWVLGIPRADAAAALDCLALLELTREELAGVALALLAALAHADVTATASFYGARGVHGGALLNLLVRPGALQPRSRLALAAAWLEERLGLALPDLLAAPDLLSRPLATAVGPLVMLAQARGVPMPLAWASRRNPRVVAAQRLGVSAPRFQDARRAFQAELLDWAARRWARDPGLLAAIAEDVARDVAEFEANPRHLAHLSEEQGAGEGRAVDAESLAPVVSEDEEDLEDEKEDVAMEAAA